jgi:hypothetical protein
MRRQQGSSSGLFQNRLGPGERRIKSSGYQFPFKHRVLQISARLQIPLNHSNTETTVLISGQYYHILRANILVRLNGKRQQMKLHHEKHWACNTRAIFLSNMTADMALDC